MEEVTETAPEVKPEPVIREEVVVNGDRETSEAGALGEGEEREAASSRVKLADIKPEKVIFQIFRNLVKFYTINFLCRLQCLIIFKCGTQPPVQPAL